MKNKEFGYCVEWLFRFYYKFCDFVFDVFIYAF